MSAITMREEFEAWECEADQGPQTDPVWLMYDAETNTYVLDKIQSRWECWQASRATLMIELPRGGYFAGYDNEHMMESRDVHDAIEAAGVKVKP